MKKPQPSIDQDDRQCKSETVHLLVFSQDDTEESGAISINLQACNCQREPRVRSEITA